MLNLCFILAISCVSSAYGLKIYGRYASFELNKATITSNWGELNLKTGETTKICVNSHFLEGEITEDGLSTIDPTNHVVYWANGIMDRYVFVNGLNSQVTVNNLRPFIDLQAQGIMGLAFDNENRNLILTGMFKTRSGEMAANVVYPVNEVNKVNIFPYTNGPKQFGAANCYQQDGQIVYNLVPGSQAQKFLNVTSMDVTNGQVGMKQIAFDGGFPSACMISKANNAMYVLTEFMASGKLSYGLCQIDGSSHTCKKVPLSLPAGILTTHAFDSNSANSQLVVFMATREGNKIISLDAATGAPSFSLSVKENFADMVVVF